MLLCRVCFTGQHPTRTFKPCGVLECAHVLLYVTRKTRSDEPSFAILSGDFVCNTDPATPDSPSLTNGYRGTVVFMLVVILALQFWSVLWTLFFTPISAFDPREFVWDIGMHAMFQPR